MTDTGKIGLVVAGWLATTWLAYRWGLQSQKLQRVAAAKSAAENRKREFLASMQAWRHEIDRLHMHEGSGGFEHRSEVFLDGVSGFLAIAETIKDDFTTPDARKQFEDLVAAVPKCYVLHHDKILKAIDDVIMFAKSAT